MAWTIFFLATVCPLLLTFFQAYSKHKTLLIIYFFDISMYLYSMSMGLLNATSFKHTQLIIQYFYFRTLFSTTTLLRYYEYLPVRIRWPAVFFLKSDHLDDEQTYGHQKNTPPPTTTLKIQSQTQGYTYIMQINA